jgi:hypothetical protein
MFSMANPEDISASVALGNRPDFGYTLVRTQNWQVSSDWSDLWAPPVRPVWSKSTKSYLDFTIGYVLSSRSKSLYGTSKSESG